MLDVTKIYLTPSEEQTLDGYLAQLEQFLDDKIVSLSAEACQRYGSINEKNKLIVNKAHDIIQSQPQFVPPHVDTAQFEKDFRARQYLEARILRIQTIVNGLTRNKITHDYTNYQDALTIYNYLQFLGKSHVNGASELTREMRQFFSRTRPNSSPTNPTTPDM